MLLDGINHVAIMTTDTDRLCAFYRQVFDATVSGEVRPADDLRLTFLDIGPGREFNVFQIDGNTEAEHQTPMFGRGRIDHLGLQAASKEASTRSGNGSWPAAPATASSPTSGPS